MQTFPHLYNGMFNCLKQTLKNDGVIRGLYAGTTPAIMANVAENSVLFAAYGYCQKLVCSITGTEVNKNNCKKKLNTKFIKLVQHYTSSYIFFRCLIYWISALFFDWVTFPKILYLNIVTFSSAFVQKVEQLSTMENATAGFLAAFFSSFTLCPTELIKCQLQAMRETSVQGLQTAVWWFISVFHSVKLWNLHYIETNRNIRTFR